MANQDSQVGAVTAHCDICHENVPQREAKLCRPHDPVKPVLMVCKACREEYESELAEWNPRPPVIKSFSYSRSR